LQAGHRRAASENIWQRPARLKRSLTSVLQDVLVFTIALELTMSNRPEPWYEASPLHFTAVIAKTERIVLSSSDTTASEASRSPARCGGAIAADLIITIPPNFIW
jgi:hypothetical protein